MSLCYNRGCGQEFDPQDNKDDSCKYHPGEPFFHDVYKGWSCCKKKSVDFTDFLNFKGCTSGKHSNEKPPEPERKKADSVDDMVEEVRAPIRPSTFARPAFDAPLTQLKPQLNANFKKSIDELVVSKVSSGQEDESDSGVIAVGTNCKNNGCTTSYQSEDSKYSECVHHPGTPVFHEGMKYWSCCQRKTSDFSVFVAQKGCETGAHKWTGAKTCDQTVECRYDWHQTGNNVVVAIYAKLYDYRESYVQVNPIRMKVRLVFPKQANAAFDLDLELRGVIDVAKSSVQMMGTKVEIVLSKAELGSWPKLNFPPKVNEVEVAALEDLTIEAADNGNETSDKMKGTSDGDDDSDSDVDLDDVGPVYAGAKITELID